MELEPYSGEFVPEVDRRRRMDEPLPVKLVAVADVTLPYVAGDEAKLEAFYVEMLQFAREGTLPPVYRADNFRLRFEMVEGPIVREDCRPVVIEVLNLKEAEEKLNAREIEFEKLRGIFVGQVKLAMNDPAGNFV